MKTYIIKRKKVNKGKKFLFSGFMYKTKIKGEDFGVIVAEKGIKINEKEILDMFKRTIKQETNEEDFNIIIKNEHHI